ncbi:MAG TPA: Rieske 2Fe-2S domain-containing protein, partial [Micromonosporaceae bacterium]|nr:Rieske 2Fe-2S domain-containing protein [Micromonosporaceae bacterium]
DVYQHELRRIFARCWVFLAHESEVPRPNDFVRRKIGQDDFIVVRDRHGTVRVLLDACRHRGVAVCRADRGNTPQFRCPYHGWTYDTSGRLTGAPAWREALAGLSKEDYGLLPAAQIATRHGLIFATLDPTAPSLEKYLGGMSWYLDLVFGLNAEGVEVLAPPQRLVISANWKSPAENFAGDDYHLATLHRSVWEVGAYPVPFEDDMVGYHVQAAPGHSLSLSMDPGAEAPGPAYYGLPDDLVASFSSALVTDEQLRFARDIRAFVGNVFPNFSVLAQPATEDVRAHPATGVITFRTWQPRGPGEMEVWCWFCAYRTMSAEQKRRSLTAGLGTSSFGGAFEMDDAEPWASASRTGRSVAAQVLGLSYNYQMGSEGVGRASRVPDFPGPGVVFATRYEEGVQRNFLRFYAELMRCPDGRWPEVPLR